MASKAKEIIGMRSNTSDAIAKKLLSIRDRDYYTVLGDFFEASAISVKNTVDINDKDVYEKRYGDIARSYGKAGMDVFADCLGLFMAEIHAAMEGSAMFRDFAGELYMASGTNSKGLGQFFTPYHVSRLMAEINVEKERFLKEIEDDPDRVITFYEPTCGAGGLMVAAIDCMKSAGINYAYNMFIDCGDIDPRCFHMSYLTLSLLGAPAVVRLGDALTMKYCRAWFTPAYIFNWTHFKSKLGGGSYPETPTVPSPKKDEARTKENFAAAAIRVSEPIADKYGQLSLF